MSARRRLERRRASAIETRRYRRLRGQTYASGAELVDVHFSEWSVPDHINRPGFDAAVALMAEQPRAIVETGTSAWGTDSTRLWDGYVAAFGGQFWSVDLSSHPAERLQGQVSEATHLVVDDSVHFLSNFAENSGVRHLDVCYLDSWDLDWDDPDPAAEHGLAEWEAVAPLLGPGSVLIVDDSPASLDWVPAPHRADAGRYLAERGYLPGKGALVDIALRQRPDVQLVWHGYNAVYHFTE